MHNILCTVAFFLVLILQCHPRGGGVGGSGPPPATTHPPHHHSSHPHKSLYTQPIHNSTSQSTLYIPHPLSVGHYDLPQDSYFVDAQHSEPFSPPPPSHTQPPNTDANLNPETARFHNLMSIPYSDHHAHTSLSFYSKAGSVGPSQSNGPKRYNFDIDVGIDQISLRRQLSFPYFYSPTFRRSYFHSPIFHSDDFEFTSSLTTHETLSLHSSSGHSLELGGTENDDDIIMISGSHDSHVIQLPELRQSSVRKSDSVLPYFKISPFSHPPSTHTQSPFTPVTNDVTTVGVTNPQEMGSAGGGEGIDQAASTEDQHRRDFQNGRIDYYGRDSFENIQQRLDAILLEDEEELRVVEPAPQEGGEEEEGGVSGETGQEGEAAATPEGAKAGGD